LPGKSDANTYGYSDCYSHTYTHGNSTSTCAKAAAHAVPSTDALRMVGSKVKVTTRKPARASGQVRFAF
jgi:hypothetical protein